MKPPVFAYRAADSVEEAVALLARHGDEAKVLAGGQTLVPMLNFRLVRPSVIVDINRIPGLDRIDEGEDGLRIGALVRHRALETSPAVKARFPVLSAAMTHVAHLAIRNRGTIGGSLSHADPAAELPTIAVLLDAAITTTSARGDRVVEAGDFFTGALSTALGGNEIVTRIDLPFLPPGTGWGFEEFARRRGDFGLAGVAAAVTVSEGRAAAVRLALLGVGDTPLRPAGAEAILVGSRCDGEALHAAAAAVRDAARPADDLHASADYRRHLIGVLAARAVTAAWRRAAGEPA